ncbi:MAG: RIP metalloprotease [Chloroflexi bacterium]|nr:M50 family metallopeptidase [Chloroflexota bacterium]MDA1146382.1 M50 family metallopeptidase [Chloroflexota bacterium]MQC82254.1 RIP metalloprotease [Chloroflexota bacterium]MQC82687.1 RIP metalloprotease [Chloroflexota bacterium]
MNERWHERKAEARAQAGRPPSGYDWARRLITIVALIAAIVLGFIFLYNAVSSAFLFIFILIALVMAHEAGHFFTAKLFGVYVHEFGLGFPPRVGAFKYGETEYSLNWLPIGGFVRLEGEEESDHPRSLSVRPRWQRLVVLGAGAVVNLILPVFLFAAALSFPHEVAVGRAAISEVLPGSPAETAGLQPGDVIYTIGGRDTLNVAEASRYIRLNVGKTVDLGIRRDGELMTIQVEARRAPPTGQGPTGISIAPSVLAPDGRAFTETQAQPPWESIPNGFRQTWDTLILAQNEIRSWFDGSTSPQFAGPIGIGQTVGEVAHNQETASDAVSPLLELAALLSINLGILNLLPLPMLDGGRIFFLLIEILRGGKRIAPEKEAIVHMAGFVVFISFALVITFIDISRIANGESVFR